MKHVVGFSGGIDSQACARWVLNRYPAEDVILLNSDAGDNEHPMTTAFVEEYSRTVHPVTAANAQYRDMWKTDGFAERKGYVGTDRLTFDGMAEVKKRFPASQSQFCTLYLKVIPAKRWIDEHLGHDDYVRYSGKRRDESEDRAETPFSGWDEFFDCEVRHPLADWTKQMCFDYVRAHKEPINPLYSLGFERVGCAPCVNSGKEDIRRWADRSPEMIDKVRAWEARVGKTFFSPIVPRMYINWIDDVVAWSRTDHGGAQFNILKQAGLERPACESKFGLCE